MSDGREKCQPGCMSFYGGEVKHRRDCVHYPESLTKIWHDLEAEYVARISHLEAQIEAMQAICAAAKELRAAQTADVDDPENAMDYLLVQTRVWQATDALDAALNSEGKQ